MMCFMLRDHSSANLGLMWNQFDLQPKIPTEKGRKKVEKGRKRWKKVEKDRKRWEKAEKGGIATRKVFFHRQFAFFWRL